MSNFFVLSSRIGAHVFPAPTKRNMILFLLLYKHATSKIGHYWNEYYGRKGFSIFLLLSYFILWLSRICFYLTNVLTNNTFLPLPGNEIWSCFPRHKQCPQEYYSRNGFSIFLLLLLYFIFWLTRICFYRTKVLRNNTTDLLSHF